MLETAKEQFEYFLAEVRKERTVVITPKYWTTFVNPIVIDWVKTKLPEHEFNQKRIEDLQAIKCLTDNDQYEFVLAVAKDENRFLIPKNETKWPRYLHGISASFRFRIFGESDTKPPDISPLAVSTLKPYDVGTITDPWGLGREDILKYATGRGDTYRAGKIYRSDKRVLNKFNPYRQPDSQYVYFEARQGSILVTSKDNMWWNVMELEYYSYPDDVEFSTTVDKPGSFGPAQNKEIMDMAVTRYLERVSDQRIQTQPSVSASVPK